MEEKDVNEMTLEESVENDESESEEVIEESNDENNKDKKGFGFVSKKKYEEAQNEIERLTKELSDAKNAYFKAYADCDNLKKRLTNESDMIKKYRIQSFASEILPVIDNLERALAYKGDDETVKTYVKGFEMIYNQLINILNNEGVKEIEALNLPFDPNYHQALMSESVEGVEAGVVVEVLQKGYVLKDRVLRASLVKVSE